MAGAMNLVADFWQARGGILSSNQQRRSAMPPNWHRQRRRLSAI
ncbi:MAG: hypothetical protein M5U34_01530 [Chloroflexi bacterium]|nr:hypothetical protein [Chloroflexota bacterium]